MLKYRLQILVASAALCFLSLTAAWTFWPEAPGISRTNFNRIQIGMAQAEVEGILDGPPRDTSQDRRFWIRTALY
jgi:hypothetical protein